VISVGAAKYLTLGSLNHRSKEKALGDTTRKIASTVVLVQPSSGMIGAASLSFLPASLPGPLALPPSFPLQSFS
jgi:hypothetical protein